MERRDLVLEAESIRMPLGSLRTKGAPERAADQRVRYARESREMFPRPKPRSPAASDSLERPPARS
jgi:hypothetical protein